MLPLEKANNTVTIYGLATLYKTFGKAAVENSGGVK